MSSVELPQSFVIVQRKVRFIPAVPVNVLVGLEGSVILPPVPFIMLHCPVPLTGVLPASVAVVPLRFN